MPCSLVAERSLPYSPLGVTRRRSARALFAAALCVLLAACSAGPGARLYVLDAGMMDSSDVDAAPAPAATGNVRVRALGVATITLPGYASDPRVASRGSRNEISVDDRHRWAEEPEDAITRVLAERLRVHGGGTVLIEPWPRNFEPNARVELAFDRLLRTSTGGVDAMGQIRVLSGDGRDVADVLSFEISRSAESTGMSDWFEAVARLIDDLAGMAIDAVSANPA